MGRELKRYVTLRESPILAPVAFGPGDKLPDWALEQIKDSEHLFTAPEATFETVARHSAVRNPEGLLPQVPDAPAAKLTEPAATDLGKPEAGVPSSDEDEVPRRNASRIVWANFAEGLRKEGFDITVTAQMSRDDIIKACEDADAIESD